MNTLSVRLRYRPVRIGWCVKAGDFEAMRTAMRLSFAIWGGRFNPIIPIDDPDQADRQISLYRVDVLYAPRPDDEVDAFIKRHKNLPHPNFRQGPVGKSVRGSRMLNFVDIRHPIAQLYTANVRGNVNPAPLLDVWNWEDNDPLRDVLTATYGVFPTPEEVGEDFAGHSLRALLASTLRIQPDGQVPPPTYGRYTVAGLNRVGINQHYSVRNFWNQHGFYLGSATSFFDLVNFWNLRAANIQLVFYDPAYATRLNANRDFFARQFSQEAEQSPAWRGVGLWRHGDGEFNHEGFGDQTSIVRVGDGIWNGLNLKAPEMYFGEGKALAALGDSYGKRTASFALSGQPFDVDFDTTRQLYVLSVDPGIGLFNDEKTTLHTLFLPELNEFYGRNCYHSWNATRAEPESLGIITEASTTDISLRGMDVTALISEVFKSVGITAKPSRAGIVGTGLIRQMGGLDGCRPFRIAGVRELVERHRPDQSFSRADALQTIRGQGQTRPLSEYQWLYIQPRPGRAELKNGEVLDYLLDKGVFRAGLAFSCPSCQLEFWQSLDEAKVRAECTYCGHLFNTMPQLRDKAWAFRRSGLFGRDDHQEGAIPVALTLQQLVQDAGLSQSIYATGMELHSDKPNVHNCETDFVVITTKNVDHKIEIVIGECKTRQPITEDDVRNLISVADAFPSDRFEVYIAFSKLVPFEPQEVDLIKRANSGWRRRAIMLTERELEPYSTYERAELEFDIPQHASGYQGMANATETVFFEQRRKQEPPV